MYTKFQDHLTKELAGIKEAGLFKNELLCKQLPRTFK
jgi:hypothetical protein